MRLIDGEALYKSLADLYKERGFNDREIHFSLKDMEMNINGAPAVDVVLNFTGVDVVRCKDCKYCSVDMRADGNAPDYVCIEMDCGVEADGFCSWGERREDGE